MARLQRPLTIKMPAPMRAYVRSRPNASAYIKKLVAEDMRKVAEEKVAS